MSPPMRQAAMPLRPLSLFVCITVLLLGGCGGSDKDKTSAPTPPVEVLYNNGLDALNSNRFSEANDEFNSLEQNYPFSSWAVNAQIMQAYSEYVQNKYTDAIATLDRFIQLHPVHRDIAYIYYLRALCYYEQIADIERDQKGTEQAMAALQAAIGRFQRVVDDYQTTAHVPEALARIVEVYLALGLVDEAKKTAAVLGYNDPGSVWYEDAYNDLAASGAVSEGLPAPSNESRGFFGRAWHALF
jgi:outer membrane protein assembly factor BamD